VLATAVAKGGIITFDCGSDPHTITVSSELLVTTEDTVLDGGHLITLSGAGSGRIMKLESSFDRDWPSLTLQRLTLRDGYTADVPDTLEISGGGAAIHRSGGRLVVIDSTFENNQGPQTGQDVAGGAIFSLGVGETIIVDSVFADNACSNGGAIGNLHSPLTVVNATLVGNAATGYDGNPGSGGNGGGISMDGVGNELTLCGVRVSSNLAHAFGGGVFRVANAEHPFTRIDQSSFQDNEISQADLGLGGGLYLQGDVIELTNSTVADNSAPMAGGLFVGPGSELDLTNATIAGNVALDGLGGGLFVDATVPGMILNTTIANNHAPDGDSFAAAIAGGDSLTLTSSVIAYHTAGNIWVDLSCNRTLGEGGGNFQWPAVRPDGSADKPCSRQITFADPVLEGLADNGGPTRTMAVGSSSPAIGAADDCPATDQRGVPRPEPCTSGAFEPE
jgi:hypothetical protein